MKLYIDPISLTVLILIAILSALVTFDLVKTISKPKETVLKTVNTVGQETRWICRGVEPGLWACREIPKP